MAIWVETGFLLSESKNKKSEKPSDFAPLKSE
jgi:hypothetical protein